MPAGEGEGGTRLETLQELHRAYQWLREDPKIQERLTELRGQMAGAGGTAGEESIDAKPPSKEGLERLGYTSEQRKALYGAMVERRERLQAAYEKGWWKGFAFTMLAPLVLEAGGAVALAGAGRTAATTAARQLATARAAEALPALPKSIGAAANITTRSRIGASSYATRLAEGLGQAAQRDVDALLTQLRAGNMNPGIGTRRLGGGFYELRGANAGRVIVKQTSGGSFDIVGKFQGHVRGDAANSAIIQRLIDDFSRL